MNHPDFARSKKWETVRKDCFFFFKMSKDEFQIHFQPQSMHVALTFPTHALHKTTLMVP
jgi:hypothetical protein